MSGHAELITRLRQHAMDRSNGYTYLTADAAKALADVEAENQRLQETVRLREESQIPMIPHGAQQKMDRLEAENQRLREALGLASDLLIGEDYHRAPDYRLMSRLLIAGELMNPLWCQTGSVADGGERLAVCAGDENSLVQCSLRLDEVKPRPRNAFQVAAGFHFGGGHRHLVCSSGLIELERQPVLATKETGGSCQPDRQARSDRP